MNRSRTWLRVPGLSAVAALLLMALSTPAQQPAPSLEAGFEQRIQPFLRTYCSECHSGKRPKAGLDLAQTRQQYPRLATLPFDPTYKLMAVFTRAHAETGDEVIRCFVKGAAPAVMGRVGSALAAAHPATSGAILIARGRPRYFWILRGLTRPMLYPLGRNTSPRPPREQSDGASAAGACRLPETRACHSMRRRGPIRDTPESFSSRDIYSSVFCRAPCRVLFASSRRPSPDLAARQLLLAGGGRLEAHVKGFLVLKHCSKWTLRPKSGLKPGQPTA